MNRGLIQFAPPIKLYLVMSEDLPPRTFNKPPVVRRLAPRIGVSIFSDDLKPGSSENVGRILESDKYSDVST